MACSLDTSREGALQILVTRFDEGWRFLVAESLARIIIVHCRRNCVIWVAAADKPLGSLIEFVNSPKHTTRACAISSGYACDELAKLVL